MAEGTPFLSVKRFVIGAAVLVRSAEAELDAGVRVAPPTEVVNAFEIVATASPAAAPTRATGSTAQSTAQPQ